MLKRIVVKLLVLALAAAGLSLVAPTAAFAAPIATATTLTVSPSDSSPQGTQLTLSATVTNAPAGFVTFLLDGAPLDQQPRPVGNGQAVTTLVIPGARTHTLAALFQPSNSEDFTPSRSADVTYKVTPDPNTNTNTALSVSPASPITEGTNPTLTATIDPPGTEGTVVFYDGLNVINEEPEPVQSNGKASVTTSLAVGSHELTAEFTPQDTTLDASTSPAITYVVNGAPPAATPTSTSLTAAPVSPRAVGTSVTFTASVTPTTAAGTVQLKDGDTNLGEPATVTNGSAQVATSSLTKGSHSMSAVFTPSSPETFDPSTANPITYVIAGNPSAPPAITATPGNASATISWTAPTDDGGTAITGYSLQQSTSGGESWTPTAPGGTGTSTATSKVVTELTNGTGYLFRVAAINAIGLSQYTATVSTVTPSAPAPTTVAIGGTPAATTYGAKVSVTARVTNSATQAPLAGAKVKLYQRLLPAKTFSLVGTFTANSTGDVSAPRTATASTFYQWQYPATSAQSAASSPVRLMNTSYVVTAAPTKTSVPHGSSVKVYGTVAGGTSGTVVYLQRGLGGKFTNVASTTLKNQLLPNGKVAVGFVFSRQLTAIGTYYFRVYVPTSASLLAGYSSLLAVGST